MHPEHAGGDADEEEVVFRGHMGARKPCTDASVGVDTSRVNLCGSILTACDPRVGSRHDRAARRARGPAQRRQRDGPRGARPRPSEETAAEGPSLRHHRRLRVPDDRGAARDLSDPAWVGETSPRRLPDVSRVQPFRRRTDGRGTTGRTAGPAGVRPVGLLGDGREGRADRHRVRHRLHPRRGRGVAETWVILTGGILGIVMMRLVIGQLLALVERYPLLVDGAFVIIGWVGLKLLVEYLHSAGYVAFEIPKWIALGLIVVIFCLALGYSLVVEKKGERS